MERDTKGDFKLVAPSCLMPDNHLNGELRRLPQLPLAPVESIPLSTLGTRHLWAGVFDDLPQWDWLSIVDNGLFSLQVQQLAELLAFAKSQKQATIWRSSYTVTAS